MARILPTRLGDMAREAMTVDIEQIRRNALMRERIRGAQALEDAMGDLRRICEEAQFCFGAVEAVLAAAATLLLKGAGTCVVLILVGAASAGKTTIARMLFKHRMVIRKDRFTLAAFVSHKADEDISTLKKKHLLPIVKDKILVTKELAPIFRGRESDLVNSFSFLASLLDGLGDASHSGAQGGIDYSEPHRFTWIGCTTPFSKEVWKVMAQLGSKLLFFRIDGSGATLDDLMSMDEVRYEENVERSTECVSRVLDALFSPEIELRSLDVAVPPLIRRRVALLSQSLSIGRAIGGADPEDPKRVLTLLLNLAKGRALVYGRRQLIEEDLSLAEHVVLSSMPGRRGEALCALQAASPNSVTVADLQVALHCAEGTARAALVDLVTLGLAEQFEAASVKPGQPASRFRLRAAL
jgi:hypothetical protein